MQSLRAVSYTHLDVYKRQIWGIRLAVSSPEAQNPMKWRGQNLLGFALMEVRDELGRITQNEQLYNWKSVWRDKR